MPVQCEERVRRKCIFLYIKCRVTEFIIFPLIISGNGCEDKVGAKDEPHHRVIGEWINLLRSVRCSPAYGEPSASGPAQDPRRNMKSENW